MHQQAPLMISFIFHYLVHVKGIFPFDQMFLGDFPGENLQTTLETFPQRIGNDYFFPKVVVLHVEEDPEVSQHFMDGKLEILGLEDAQIAVIDEVIVNEGQVLG